MRNQRERRKIIKRLISGVSALALSVGLLASIPASADDSSVGYKYTLFAYSSEEGAITSSAANFCVNGNIATNGTISAGQNFNVNGEKKEHANEAMPDLTKAVNENFFTENVDVKAENYAKNETNIEVKVPTDVKGKAELKGNIKLAACVKAMGDITLSGGVLNNDNTVLFSENGNVVINSENVSLTGLVYAPKGNIVIDSKCLNLNSVVMIANKITLNSSNININNSASMAKFVQESIDKNGGSNGNDEPEPEEDPVVYAYGEYNEETKSVDIEWYSNVTGEFAVLESMNGTDYTVVSKVSDDTKYSIKVTSDFIKKYFKVATIKGTETFESIPFTIVNANGTYSTELLDTDKDGLADLYEEILGTDKTLPDTDNDGLTDYEEAYITGTDPTKYDSVTEGVSDADADSDKDGLNNKKEIEIKTDPNSDDTDGDTLKDGDEISKYNTDPLKKDTDGDGINDGDEILLKLDPTNPVTNGVKDSEHYFEQEISADSKVFSQINTEDNPYTLSMKINCTGYAESNVTASESSYHSAIESEMTVGTIADISLNETCKNKEIVLYYKINNADEDSSSDSDTELKGINKYCIFSFDKEHNAVIPVMTYYDEANSAIYASVNDSGTFGVINTEIWKDAINKVEPDKFVTTQEVIDKADIVFSINTCGLGLGDSDLKMMKENIKENAKMIFKNSKDVRIAVLGYSQRYKSDPYCTHTFLSNKSEWAANMEELTELLNQIEIDNQSRSGVLELGLQDIATPIIGVGQPYSFRDGAEIYSFVYTRSDNVFYIGNSFSIYRIDRICSLRVIIDKLKTLGIRTSFVMNDENLSTISVLEYYVTDPTGGAFATYTSDEFGVNSKGVYEYLNTTAKKTIIEAPDQSFDNTVFVSSLSLQPIRLSRSLYVKSDNDTDNDGLTDWEEIDNKSYELSSDAEYGFESKSFDDVLKLNGEKEQEIRRLLKDKFGDKYYALCKLPFLYLLSDPTKQDSDGDGLDDLKETNGFYYESINGKQKHCVGDPIHKGINGGYCGELAIISCTNGLGGHAFLVYHSFIDDMLDFSGFAKGYNYMTWTESSPREYEIKPFEYVAIGAAGNNATASSFHSELSESDGNDKDDAGVYFNREFALEKANYDKNYNHMTSFTFIQEYDENYATYKLVTKKQIDSVVDAFAENNWYNLVDHNCAHVAVMAWNRLCGGEYFIMKNLKSTDINESIDELDYMLLIFVFPIGIYNYDKKLYKLFSPSGLKDQIAEDPNRFVFDMYKVFNINLKGDI